MRQNLEGVPIPNCSEYITLHVYQFWCFYEKVNNSPKISLYAAALLHVFFALKVYVIKKSQYNQKYIAAHVRYKP